MIMNHSIQRPGQMVDRYRLLQLLGRGGIGEVWQAEDTQLRRQVAIKLLNPVMRTEEEYLRAFADEARVAASLEHPHILPVHDFGEIPAGEEVITYLIMPLMSGGSLQTLLRNQPGSLPVDVSLKYLRQAAEAIDFMHRQQVVHRNIKPANLLLQDQNLFLADFGIARLLSTETYRSRTTAGAGAPEYMAPEQAQGHPGPASDRYSLAVIAYELLTGRVPFQDEDPFTVLLKHMQEPPAPPRQYNFHIPEAMQQIMLKGL